MAECKELEEVVDRTVISGSEGLEYTCQPCSKDEQSIEAAGFCVDCSEFLCNECFKYHPKPIKFQHHQLVDIEQVKQGDFSKSQDQCSKKCHEHRGKTIKYFCDDHKRLACGVCINLDHRTCPNVQYISKVSESVAEGEEFSTLIQGLETIIHEAKEIIEVSKNDEGKTQESHSKALEDMKQVIKDATEALQSLQNEIEVEAEKLKCDRNKKLDESLSLCNEIQTKSAAVVSNLTRLKDSGQNCNLFVTIETEKSNVKYFQEQLDQISRRSCINSYLFQPCKYLKEFKMHKAYLGKVLQQKTATKIGQINVKTQTDKTTCCVYGSVILSNNRMAVVDYTNQKVKLIDLKMSKVIHEIALKRNVYQVAKTSEADEIAVSCSTASTIMTLKIINDTLLKDLEIKTSDKCYGLSSINDKFIVRFRSPERLDIIDRQGKVIQTIQTDADGKSLFQDIRCVAVDNASEAIYVPDYVKQTVTCLSLSGQVKSVHEGFCMKGARGIILDRTGNVIVCCDKENIIEQFTPDLKEMCIISTADTFDSLRSVCYCKDTHCLYVGQNKDTIQVYQLP